MAGSGAPPVVLAVGGAPHGVRGEVRLKLFGRDPGSLVALGPLDGSDGRAYEVLDWRDAGAVVVARLKGIADRDAAARLNGVTLSVPRDRLPPPDDADEFYHADLIGLRVESQTGEAVGTIVAIHDFGAGDVIEIAPPRGAPRLLAFTRANVPTIDLAGGHVVVAPPAEIDARPEADPEAEA